MNTIWIVLPILTLLMFEFFQRVLQASGRGCRPLGYIDGAQQPYHAPDHSHRDELGDPSRRGKHRQTILANLGIPAILYSLMMNVVLLTYVAIVRKADRQGL